MPAIIRAVSVHILCPMLSVAAANAAQDDWLTYRHDSARTGAQPVASDLSDPGKVSNLHVAAQFPPQGSPAIAGGFKASPIVVDGTAFIGGVNGYFYALDAATGALKWQYPKAGDQALIGSCVGDPFAGGYGTYGIASGATFAVIGGQNAVIFGAPDPTAEGGLGSARLFAFPLSANPNNPQPIWKSDVVAHVTGCNKGSFGELHERIAYSSPLVFGDSVYVGIHDTGDSPIQQGRVIAVDLNTGHVTGFQFLGAGNAPGDGNRGGGVWNALATDGTGVYFTTGNTQPAPWCTPPYGIGNCPLKTEPPNDHGLSMIRVDKDTGNIKWAFRPVPFFFDGDPDWAAGASVMSTSCGELIASVQKDGWSYAIDASQGPSCPLSGHSWQFPPTTKGCTFTDPTQQHGDDDYRRPGAAWNDVFIVRTGGENLVADGVAASYSKLHALNACATSEQDRVRWIADIPNNTAANGHVSYSTPTVTGGIVFIGTNEDPIDRKGHLVVLADPSVAPASQQICSNVDFPVASCPAPFAPVWKLQAFVDVPMPDGGSLASMRNEPVLAEGQVFVATNPSAAFPNAGHVYILAPEDISTIVPEIFAPDTVTTIIESN